MKEKSKLESNNSKSASSRKGSTEIGSGGGGSVGGLTTTTNNTVTLPVSPKTRLAMLKRSSTKLKAVASNDPFRFQGGGVDFKGKLIGVRDVDEARGDAMCAEAMRLAKAAVKSLGQHKPRIVLNISIEGLKIKDEKTQTILHNFPVSRISFIARDTTDARAFGFIYGCSNNNYKFYGIKTAQTADRAVLSIRDMFQIVFEMKKAHLAEVKQKQEEQKKQESTGNAEGVRIDDGVAVADLLDLESELHNIEQGYNQLQNIPAFAEDSWPTNDLFSSAPNSASLSTIQPSAVPPPVFAFKISKSDLFDDSFNPRSADSNTSTADISPQRPPAVPPAAFNAQPMFAIGSQPLINQWSQSNAFPAISLSETNPFVTSVSSVIASGGGDSTDPFDTRQAQRVLQASTYYQQISQQPVCWPSNENSIPATTEPNKSQWAETKRVSTLEEAFNKLVDFDSLVAASETKKNPFENIINPPKVPISTLASVQRPPCIPARTTAPLVVSTTANDPFNDEFFH